MTTPNKKRNPVYQPSRARASAARNDITGTLCRSVGQLLAGALFSLADLVGKEEQGVELGNFLSYH